MRILKNRFHLVLAGVSLAIVCFLYFSARHVPEISPDAVAERSHSARILILIRHGERCDRSDNPCSAGPSGITIPVHIVRGNTEHSSESTYRCMPCTPRIPSEQYRQARYFGRQEAQVIKALGYCDERLLPLLRSLSESTQEGVSVIFTHNHCLSFLARTLLNRKFRPDYLDGLVLENTGGRLVIDGHLKPDI
ncbi:hypothetical protein [Escherichia coli]|uniref:hypothetical protein n=1 Tax=Escherichia coli TaxID=562 RepID=UPI000685B58F|nr:hypothetical protein [Escherichia coli]